MTFVSQATVLKRIYDAERNIEWAVNNDGVETIITDYGATYLPPTAHDVVRLSTDLGTLASLLRSSLDEPLSKSVATAGRNRLARQRAGTEGI